MKSLLGYSNLIFIILFNRKLWPEMLINQRTTQKCFDCMCSAASVWNFLHLVYKLELSLCKFKFLQQKSALVFKTVVPLR